MCCWQHRHHGCRLQGCFSTVSPTGVLQHCCEHVLTAVCSLLKPLSAVLRMALSQLPNNLESGHATAHFPQTRCSSKHGSTCRLHWRQEEFILALTCATSVCQTRFAHAVCGIAVLQFVHTHIYSVQCTHISVSFS